MIWVENSKTSSVKLGVIALTLRFLCLSLLPKRFRYCIISSKSSSYALSCRYCCSDSHFIAKVAAAQNLITLLKGSHCNK